MNRGHRDGAHEGEQPPAVDPWEKYERPPALDPRSIQHGRLFFTPLERMYRRELGSLPCADVRALDLGCGYARNAVYLLSSGRARSCTGVDRSAAALRGAEKMRTRWIPESGARLHLVHDEIDRFFARDRRAYDLVVCSQVLNYERDLEGVMRRIREHLAPGGRLFITDAHRPPRSLATTLARIRSGGESAQDEDLVFHDPVEVVRVAERLGLRLVRQAYARHALFYMLEDVLFWLTSRRFEREVPRLLASTVYRVLAAAISLEDRLLHVMTTGTVYWLGFELRRQMAQVDHRDA